MRESTIRDEPGERRLRGPTLSIVTVSLNQGRYLEQAVRSVLDQDPAALEYVVMDGGSTDESVEVLRRHERRLHSWFSGPDRGPAAALNEGFARTTGEICGYVNADDFLLPGALARVIEAFARYPETDVVYGDGLLVDATEHVVRPIYSDPWSLRRYAFGACVVIQPATFFRRGAFERAGGFREENRTCWDGELLADMALAGAGFLHLPEALAAFRLHPESISGSGRLEQFYPRDWQRIFRKIVGRYPSTLDRLLRFPAWRSLRFLGRLRRPFVLARRGRFRPISPRRTGPGERPVVAWVGAHPAHYVRAFHRRIEEAYGPDVAFFYMPPSAVEQVERRYEVGDLPRRSLVLSAPGSLRQTAELLRALRRADPAMVVVAGHFPRSLLAASLWARATRRRVCYWSDVNLQDVLRRGWLRRRLQRALMAPYLRGMARLLYVGTQTRQFYEWCCASGRLPPPHRLPYPHDPEPFWNADELRPAARTRLADGAELVVLYLGRLVESKGVDLLLRGLARLPPDIRSRVRVQIVGSGPSQPRLESLAASLDVRSTVSFLGEQPSDHTAWLYAAADVVVVPSRQEPWGLVINEALSSRRPVIAAAHVGAVADLVEDGVTGFVLPNASPESIAEALRRAFALRSSLPLMGRRGQKLVQEGGWTLAGAVESWRELVEADLGVLPRRRSGRR